MWTDGETDMMKLTVAFGNFANAHNTEAVPVHTTTEYRLVAVWVVTFNLCTRLGLVVSFTTPPH